MQSVALHIVAFVVFKRLMCSALFDNVKIPEIRKECELLNDFFLMTHGFSKLLFSYQEVDQKVIALHIMNRIIEIVNETLVPLPSTSHLYSAKARLC